MPYRVGAYAVIISLALLLSAGLPAPAVAQADTPTVVQLERPQMPYRITPEMTNAWAEALGPDGARYVAYCADGLTNPRDIYLAVDSNNNGLFEAVYPTGLSDLYGSYLRFGSKSQGELSLRIENGRLVIGHHFQVDALAGCIMHSDTSYREDSITLDQLSADTDGDGLTDITEHMLITDPLIEDSDGDGVIDLIDGSPNANPSAISRVERGIVRALEYLQTIPASAEAMNAWLRPEQRSLPWQAAYYSISDHGTPDFWSNDDELLISLDLGSTIYAIGGVSIYVPFDQAGWPDKIATGAMLFASGTPVLQGQWTGQYGDLLLLYWQAVGEPRRPINHSELLKWAADTGVDLSTVPYRFEVNVNGLNCDVVLEERSGELYPVRIEPPLYLQRRVTEH